MKAQQQNEHQGATIFKQLDSKQQTIQKGREELDQSVQLFLDFKSQKKQKKQLTQLNTTEEYLKLHPSQREQEQYRFNLKKNEQFMLKNKCLNDQNASLQLQITHKQSRVSDLQRIIVSKQLFLKRLQQQIQACQAICIQQTKNSQAIRQNVKKKLQNQLFLVIQHQNLIFFQNLNQVMDKLECKITAISNFLSQNQFSILQLSKKNISFKAEIAQLKQKCQFLIQQSKKKEKKFECIETLNKLEMSTNLQSRNIQFSEFNMILNENKKMKQQCKQLNQIINTMTESNKKYRDLTLNQQKRLECELKQRKRRAVKNPAVNYIKQVKVSLNNNQKENNFHKSNKYY